MINKILERLQKVNQTNPNQWIACCPAHADRSPRLALKQCDNGKILIKCWAGCGIDDIVVAIGLQLTDLFPPKEGDYGRQQREYFSAETVLKSLHKESIVMRFLASEIRQGVKLKEDDIRRAELAEDRIHEACSYVK